ncbi:MAG: hypothetical protein P8Z50_02390 [candidate division WOR-3 bacterium]
MFYKLLKFCGKTIDRIIWKFYADIYLKDILTRIGEHNKITEPQRK